jgi:hypothetical protein
MAALCASIVYGIPRKTLQGHFKRQVSSPGVSTMGNCQTALSTEVELDIYKHIHVMEKALCGLTTTRVCGLAVIYC